MGRFPRGNSGKRCGIFCEVCHKKLRSRYHLKLHSAVHTGEKNFMCGVCKKSYQQKWNLITHMARVHGKEKPFECKDCGKAFGYSSHFKRHIKKHFVQKMEVDDAIKQRILNPFQCKSCDKCFDSKYRLDVHQRRHSNERPYICDKCGINFTTKRMIVNHMTKKHIGEISAQQQVDVKKAEKKETMPCEVCGKSITRTSMRKHLNIHYRNRVYECRYCKREFLESGQRMVHERKHTGEKPYLCDICGSGHSQQANLLTHLKRSHNLGEKPKTPESNENLIEKNDNNIHKYLEIAGAWIKRKFQESKCPKRVETESDQDDVCVESVFEEIPKKSRVKSSNVLKLRRQINKKIFEKITESLRSDDEFLKMVDRIRKITEKDQLREFLKSVKNIPENAVVRESLWHCWMCESRFANRHLLARHLLIHEPKEERPFKCELCLKTFTQSNNYKEHVMSHNQENQFYCEKCGSGFRHKSHFKNHSKRHDDGEVQKCERKFGCEMCGKKFQTSHHKEEHVRTHTKEKPFLCKVCGSQFSALSTLNRHANIHAGVRFQCQTCLKYFRQKSSLKRHNESAHSGEMANRVVCDCGKSFTQKSSLKKHKIICENNAKPVVKEHGCILCPKRFVTRSDLKRHAATHENSKKYKCDLCALELKTAETFSRHVKRHIKKNNFHDEPLIPNVEADPSTINVTGKTLHS